MSDRKKRKKISIKDLLNFAGSLPISKSALIRKGAKKIPILKEGVELTEKAQQKVLDKTGKVISKGIVKTRDFIKPIGPRPKAKKQPSPMGKRRVKTKVGVRTSNNSLSKLVKSMK
tara:strand:+ start:627 stop:974 length:348 start_codon:yes stop_codon:yes gene_type:complete